MPSSKNEFDRALKNFEKEAKLCPPAQIKDAVAASKKSGDVEKACIALDKAIAAADAKAIRAAHADLENAVKSFSSKFTVLNLKAGKALKANAKDKAAENMLTVATEMISGMMMISQSAQINTDDALDKLNVDKTASMPATSFFGDWSMAKRTFEGLTNKKKPAPSFMSAFRSSTGLETATKALDTATKANDPVKLKKAYDEYMKTAKEYASFVQKTAKVAVLEHDTDIPGESEDEFNYTESLEILLKQLNVIRVGAEKILKAAK